MQCWCVLARYKCGNLLYDHVHYYLVEFMSRLCSMNLFDENGVGKDLLWIGEWRCEFWGRSDEGSIAYNVRNCVGRRVLLYTK